MAEESVAASVEAPAEHAEIAIDAPEPWEPFETQLVSWSIGIGIAGLIVLGTLVNIYLLD
ncbi:MAG: hypothetical protein ISR44_00250 [Rhodospirillales bacterium]|nr:hypothetical protein [Rhodospirillales bacterium]